MNIKKSYIFSLILIFIYLIGTIFYNKNFNLLDKELYYFIIYIVICSFIYIFSFVFNRIPKYVTRFIFLLAIVSLFMLREIDIKYFYMIKLIGFYLVIPFSVIITLFFRKKHKDVIVVINTEFILLFWFINISYKLLLTFNITLDGIEIFTISTILMGLKWILYGFDQILLDKKNIHDSI